MPYSQKDIEKMIQARADLENIIEAYFDARYEADPEWRQVDAREGWYEQPSIDSIVVWDNAQFVELECSGDDYGRGCCGKSYRTYKFPTSDLWTDQTEILAGIKARAEAAAKKEADRKAEQEAQRQKDLEAAERRQLAELKAKYDGEG